MGKNSMSLKELFWSKGFGYYPTDKDTHHNYLTTYGELFSKWENSPINILEVGTAKGGSIKLFEDYFVNANIIGYDIVPPEIKFDRATVIVKDFYNINPDELPELTIAIDDGPHDVLRQVDFVKMVYPRMVPGGILVVEDVVTGQRPHFDALGIPYTLVKFCPYDNVDDNRILIFRK